MNKVLFALLGCLLAGNLLAAEADWMTDLAQAQSKAKKDKKAVLLDFTGSDWCPPCKMLHKNVFSSQEFNEYASKNLVLVEVDFPRRKTQSPELKKANRELAEKHGIEAYPTVIILDANGKELWKDSGYSGETAKEYIAKIKKATAGKS